MSSPAAPDPATLVFGLLLARDVRLDDVLARVAHCFGPVGPVSAERPFPQSAYYDREMGPGVRRAFAAIEGEVDPGSLADLKLRSNALEGEWLERGRRQVNLDPGLLDLTHLVLATGKPAGHRVYLGRGIHAEIEYVFECGSFKTLPWTYPDYREPEAIAFFNGIREDHRRRRKPVAPAPNPQPATRNPQPTGR